MSKIESRVTFCGGLSTQNIYKSCLSLLFLFSPNMLAHYQPTTFSRRYFVYILNKLSTSRDKVIMNILTLGGNSPVRTVQKAIGNYITYFKYLYVWNCIICRKFLTYVVWWENKNISFFKPFITHGIYSFKANLDL